MVNAGQIIVDPDGYIDLDKNDAELSKRKPDGVGAHKLKTGPPEAKSVTIDYVKRYHEARAKLEETKARRAELKYKQEEQELCMVQDVQRAAFEQGRKIRDALLMIPNKFADKETKKIVKEEIEKILQEISK
jgi:phage terminase Nu1 subunit (DNA packaging protein)